MVLGNLRGQGCIRAQHHLSQRRPRCACRACMCLQRAAQLGRLAGADTLVTDSKPGGVRAFIGLQQAAQLGILAAWSNRADPGD